MKLRRNERSALGWIFVAAYATGALLFALSRWIRVASAVGEQHHPLEQWVRSCHTSVTYFVLLGLGYMLKGHILPALKAGKGLKSGLGLVTVFGALILSAVGILYGGESSLTWISIQLHDWLGMFLPLLLAGHLLGQYARKRITRPFRAPAPLQSPAHPPEQSRIHVPFDTESYG